MSSIFQYLTSSGTKQSELAAVLGISRGYMSELVGGTKSPSRSLAVKIELVTHGKVKVASWDNDSSLNANPAHPRQAGLPKKRAGAA